MKNKVLSLVMASSLLICYGNLVAKERRGAEVEILKKDRTALKGELIAVKPASLLVLESQSGADLSVDIEDINTIKIIKKSKGLPGFLIGLGVGFLAGTAVAQSGPEDSFMWSDEEALGMMMVPALALGGLAVGMLLGTDQAFQPAAMTPSEIKACMEKLRHEARITNFQ